MRKKKVKANYVDNTKFSEALGRFRVTEQTLRQHEEGSYIGECIMKICQNLSLSKNFIGYTFREEMIEDAIENCIRYVRNYDPDFSKYAFSYFSRIAYFAFIRRIKKEQEVQRVKFTVMSDSTELTNIINKHADNPNNADMQIFVNQIQSLMAENDGFVEIKEKPKRAKRKVKPGPMVEFMEVK